MTPEPTPTERCRPTDSRGLLGVPAGEPCLSAADVARLLPHFDRAGDGVLVVDDGHRIVQISPAAARLLGHPPAALLGEGLDALVSPGPPAERGLREVIATDGAWPSPAARRVIALRGAGGAEIVVEAEVEQLLVPPGTAPRMAVFLRDARPRMRAERVLRVLRAAHDAIAAAATEKALYDAVCRVLVESGGYAVAWVGIAEHDQRRTVRPVAHAGPGEAVADNDIVWADVEHGRGPTGTAIRTGKPAFSPRTADDPALAPWRAAALGRGLASSIALPLSFAGRVFGSVTVYAREPEAFDEDTARLLLDLVDTVAYAASALRDRAELSRLNAELEARVAERAAELEDLYDHAPCGYHALGSDGRILRVNATELGWLGYRREELLGRSFAELLAPASRANFEHRLALLCAPSKGDYHGETEHEMVRKDGTTFWVANTFSAVRDADGNFVRSRGAVLEITERRRAEQALRRSRDELEAANEALRRASRAKDEFLAAMSHELRTPLNAVLGLSEALQEGVYGPLAPRQLTALERVEASGKQLLTLINDILDLTKLLASTIELDLGPVRLAEACVAARAAVQEAASKKHLTLVVETEVATLRADARRLQQILVNLLGNAVKFTPDGGEVHLRASLDEARAMAIIVVEDDGPGISADHLGRIFQPFVQVDGSLSRQHGGTGLGLSLVQRFVRLHGGRIEVQSAPGRGSRFTVKLPVEGPTAE
jgi:PAS domain S-box-containing protein